VSCVSAFTRVVSSALMDATSACAIWSSIAAESPATKPT
jgi:hypothetical protein